MKKLLILFIVFALGSCSVQKRCERLNCAKQTEYVKEYITNTVYKDSLVPFYIQGERTVDSIPYEVIIYKDGTTKVNSKVSHLTTSLAYSDAWIQDGKLRHTLTQRDSVLWANVKNAIRITQSMMKEQTTKVVEVRKLTWWDKFFRHSGEFAWVVLILFAAYKGYKIYRWLYK